MLSVSDRIITLSLILLKPSNREERVWVLILSCLSPYSRSKQSPVGILPPLGPPCLTSWPLPLHPTSISHRRGPASPAGAHFAPPGRPSLLHLPALTQGQTVATAVWPPASSPILGFTDAPIQDTHPNTGKPLLRTQASQTTDPPAESGRHTALPQMAPTVPLTGAPGVTEMSGYERKGAEILKSHEMRKEFRGHSNFL